MSVGFDFTRFLALQSKVYNKRFLRYLLIKKIIKVLFSPFMYVYHIWYKIMNDIRKVRCRWLLNNNRPWNRMLESNQPPHLHNRPTQFFFQTKKTQRCVDGLPLQCISWFRFTLTETHVLIIFSPCSLGWEAKDEEHECICKSIASFTFMGEISWG